MTQNRRQEAIDGFRSGKYDILVATDIMARGIDVAEISHVINFDVPDTVDAYTHRIGRTGRAEQTGEAFTFAAHTDEIMIRDIERVLGAPIERRKLTGFDYGGFAPESQTQQNHRNQPARPPSRPSSAPQNRPAGGRQAVPASAARSFEGSSASRRSGPQRRRRTAGMS